MESTETPEESIQFAVYHSVTIEFGNERLTFPVEAAEDVRDALDQVIREARG